MRLRRVSFLTVLAVAGSVAAVRAQNIVVNAQFDTTVVPWTAVTPVSATIVWSSLDWQGSPTSGSGLVTNTGVGMGTSGAQSPCLATTVAGNYELGGQVRVPTQGNVGEAWVELWLHASPSCADNPTTVVAAQHVPWTTPDVWVPTLVTGFSLPAGQAFRIYLNVYKLSVPQTMRAHFDFVRFGLEGTTPVELQQVEVE